MIEKPNSLSENIFRLTSEIKHLRLHLESQVDKPYRIVFDSMRDECSPYMEDDEDEIYFEEDPCAACRCGQLPDRTTFSGIALTLRECQDMSGLSRSFLVGLIKTGRLKAFKPEGKDWSIMKEDFEDFTLKHKIRNIYV